MLTAFQGVGLAVVFKQSCVSCRSGQGDFYGSAQILEAGGNHLVVAGDLIAVPARGGFKRDRRQTAVCKGIAADGGNTCGNGDLRKGGAAVEAPGGDHRQLGATFKGNALQGRTSAEHTTLDAQHIVTVCAVFHNRDAGGNDDGFQCSAVRECLVFDLGEVFGEFDRFEHVTANKALAGDNGKIVGKLQCCNLRSHESIVAKAGQLRICNILKHKGGQCVATGEGHRPERLHGGRNVYLSELCMVLKRIAGNARAAGDVKHLKVRDIQHIERVCGSIQRFYARASCKGVLAADENRVGDGQCL